MYRRSQAAPAIVAGRHAPGHGSTIDLDSLSKSPKSRRLALSLGELVRSSILQRVKPESEEEIDWYVRLAQELDDGEAQALAIAKVRGFVPLTDDDKATRIAKTSELSVETTFDCHSSEGVAVNGCVPSGSHSRGG